MHIRPADCVFVLCTALFCLAALAGTKLILPDGVCMDSDLQNYTQILASWLCPDLSRGDPLYPTYALFPGIPNLFMSMAHWFSYDGNAAYGIFRAGALTIFLHFVCFYALGRWLFRSAGLSALFSLCMSITFYWSFGTFWGATHSEPVPRVLYAGLFYPLWLFLGTLAFRRVWLRPVLLFGIGLSVQVHSLSVITCAAMFLMAFLLNPRRRPFGRHILTVVLCAAAFALPALPLVISHMGSMAGKLPAADLEMINQCWKLLAEKDWAAPWNSLGRAILRYTFPAAFLPLGLAAWCVAKRMSWRLTPEAHYLLGLLPGFLLGIAGMLALCFVEMNFAGRMGYKYVSQDLFRGTRFLIPLCWLSCFLCLSCFWRYLPALVRRTLPVILLAAVAFCSRDMQWLAARHFTASALGAASFDSPETARLITRSKNCRDALFELERRSGTDDLVYTDTSELSVRYVAMRHLVPTYKDGWMAYYARDMRLLRPWLAEQQARTAARDAARGRGSMPAAGWSGFGRKGMPFDAEQARISLETAARWKASWLLLYNTPDTMKAVDGHVVYANSDWILAEQPLHFDSHLTAK